jgi:NADH-quinone oxidoreductase subunit E
MSPDKPTDDLVSKLYAEWVSAGVKLSVAGFAAAAKIADATAKALVSAKPKPMTDAAPKQTVAKQAQAPAKPSPAKSSASAAKPVATPQAAEPVATKAAHDDLKQIGGIGPKLEQMLVANGITSFSQLAKMDDLSIQRLDNELNLGGRIARDEWAAQAKKLAGS